jgi:hypothetical protein
MCALTQGRTQTHRPPKGAPPNSAQPGRQGSHASQLRQTKTPARKDGEGGQGRQLFQGCHPTSDTTQNTQTNSRAAPPPNTNNPTTLNATNTHTHTPPGQNWAPKSLKHTTCNCPPCKHGTRSAARKSPENHAHRALAHTPPPKNAANKSGYPTLLPRTPKAAKHRARDTSQRMAACSTMPYPQHATHRDACAPPTTP